MTLHAGLDLGGTSIKTAVVRRKGDDLELVSTGSVDTGAADGPNAVAANLIAVGRQLIEESDVVTFGLGVPGHFDRDTGEIVIFPNLAGDWPGFPLRDRVSESLGVETWMINDARAFTLAEGLVGAGKGHTTVACLTLGTGVGGGLMIDGRLHRGAFGVAGEIGHQTVLPDGPPCGCGNRGCLEALVKADVLASSAGRPTVSEVFAGAREGDHHCVEAVASWAGYLGIGLGNLVTIFGPDLIVVGGGIAEAGDLVLEPIAKSVKSRVTLVPTERIEIVTAQFGRHSGAIGAALAGATRQ